MCDGPEWNCSSSSSEDVGTPYVVHAASHDERKS